MEDSLGACKVFDTFILPTYTCVCVHNALKHWSALLLWVSSRAMCAYTFLQGRFSTSPNGECDYFPPFVTGQHEEISCSKMHNKRTMFAE
jgi:hypothetical protein